MCSKIEAASSNFYKMYFLLLKIKNSLFLKNLVYYFSFLVIKAMNKEPLKLSKMLKHTVQLYLEWIPLCIWLSPATVIPLLYVMKAVLV